MVFYCIRLKCERRGNRASAGAAFRACCTGGRPGWRKTWRDRQEPEQERS